MIARLIKEKQNSYSVIFLYDSGGFRLKVQKDTNYLPILGFSEQEQP